MIVSKYRKSTPLLMIMSICGKSYVMLTIVSPTPVSKTQDIAKWIRAARKELGWNQSELARRANVSRSVVQKLEEGRGTTVNLDTVLRLMRSLSLDLAVEPRSAKLKELSEQFVDDA